MFIEIINVSDPVQQAGARTPYHTMSVSYKNDKGQVGSKNLVSYAYPEVFAFFRSKARGSKVEVTVVKNAKGYLDWTAAADSDGTMPMNSGPTTVSRPTPTKSSSYESKEDRDQRQQWIIRQSSLAQAVASLKTDKATVNPKDAIALAEQYESWVTRVDANQAVLDIESDVPQ